MMTKSSCNTVRRTVNSYSIESLPLGLLQMELVSFQVHFSPSVNCQACWCLYYTIPRMAKCHHHMEWNVHDSVQTMSLALVVFFFFFVQHE